MSTTKKNIAKKKHSSKRMLRKKKAQTVIVIKSTHDAKDTLFPEKVAKANQLLIDFKFDKSKLFK